MNHYNKLAFISSCFALLSAVFEQDPSIFIAAMLIILAFKGESE